MIPQTSRYQNFFPETKSSVSDGISTHLALNPIFLYNYYKTDHML